MACCAHCSSDGVMVRCRNANAQTTDFGPNKVAGNNILASDVNNLRTAINNEITIRRNCTHCCGSPSNISGSNVSSGNTISTTDWERIRWGIDQLTGNPGGVSAGGLIYASKINSYRTYIHNLEDDCLCDSNCPGDNVCTCNNDCNCDGYHGCCGNSSS